MKTVHIYIIVLHSHKVNTNIYNIIISTCNEAAVYNKKREKGERGDK